MIFDERNIVHRAQQGDAEAFGQLVEAYQGQVYRLALRMGLSPADAEEAAQEAFIAAWRGLPRFRGDSRFSTWLYQLATHAAINLMRPEKKYKDSADVEDAVLPDTAESPQEEIERREKQETVQRALQALSPQGREILLLRYQAELGYEEIAAVLGLPNGTVKSRINRAKAQLKEALLRQGNFFGSDAVQETGEEERS